MDESIDYNDIEISDGNVLTSFEDGIPSIKFFDWAQNLIKKSLSRTIIVKLLSRFPRRSIRRPNDGRSMDGCINYEKSRFKVIANLIEDIAYECGLGPKPKIYKRSETN
ncbi:hypothetical protein Gohar_015314 [Gossypium harknessii]|uniref:Uncharacterized protein n=1 Tax=Gossypium harknessii TaxID=34285 RepID=A0A7J9FZD1_9ROSI|nr:hypothetical protein [Gossypium harknessii]